MSSKAVVSLTTGLEDPEKVTVAFLVALGAAEQRRPTLTFLTKEAVRLASAGVAQGVACEGCPPLPDLVRRRRGSPPTPRGRHSTPPHGRPGPVPSARPGAGRSGTAAGHAPSAGPC